MADLVLEEVSYTYPEDRNPKNRRGDLADINMSMSGAGIAAVVGAVGSGTNTLLNLMAGTLRPDAGRVLWDGKPTADQSIDKGVVFHQSTLYPWLSVAENLEFGLKARNIKRSERKRRVAEYLERFHLTQKATQPVYQIEDHHDLILISFARCLVCEPGLVLVGDEPLSQINDRFRSRLQKALLGFWRDKRPMLFFITSDVEEALVMASQIYIMSGRPGRLVKQYSTAFCEQVHNEGAEAVRHLPQFRDMRREILQYVI